MQSKWDNYFDEDDVLGYPLKPIGASYDKAVNRDIAINAGTWLTSWNPLSHEGYWTDDDLISPTARRIIATLALL